MRKKHGTIDPRASLTVIEISLHRRQLGTIWRFLFFADLLPRSFYGSSAIASKSGRAALRWCAGGLRFMSRWKAISRLLPRWKRGQGNHGGVREAGPHHELKGSVPVIL